jgi:outer membrane receptor for ferrienterochelin and colicins
MASRICQIFLKRIPELDITDHAGRFGELYSFRGITGNDRFLVLINGHKLNPASGTFISIGNSISIKYADRVEIIYGPASAVYGADAFSGIVNIVFEETSIARKDIQISAYSDYGSMNSLDAGFEGQFRLNKNLSFNLNARIYKSDGFDIVGSDPAYDIINNYLPPIKNACEQPKNDHHIYFNTSYKNISINYYRQQFDEGNAMGHNPSIYIFDYENRWKTSTNLIWLTYQKDFTNQGTLSFGLSYKNHQQDNNSAFKKWVVPGEPGDVFYQYMTGKDNTLHAVFTYNQVLNEKLRFIVGFDNEYTMSIPPYANDEVLGNSLKI